MTLYPEPSISDKMKENTVNNTESGLKKPVAVFFDLDDTLAFELDFIKSGFRAVDKKLAPLTAPFVEPGEIELVMSGAANCKMNHYDALQGFLESVLPDTLDSRIDSLVKEAVHICRHHEPDYGYQLREGVKEMLDELKGKGISIGLITEGRSLTQRNKINSLGLSQWIPENMIFISEEVGSAKDSEEIFQQAASQLPEGTRLIYVGDNPTKDFFIPKKSGWETIRIAADRRNIHFPYPSVDSEHQADKTIDSFNIEI